MKKTSRFTVRTRTNRNRPPKFGLTNAMLQGKRRVLKHHHRSQSPRRATLRRYNINRSLEDVDMPNTPRQRGRFREIDIEVNPRRIITPNNLLQRTKFGLTNAMLQGKRRVLTHHHRSQSPRKATLKRYNAYRPYNDFNIPNTPRQRGRFIEIDIEPLYREPINRKSSSSSSRKKRKSIKYGK
jgi:hypothetical protein